MSIRLWRAHFTALPEWMRWCGQEYDVLDSRQMLGIRWLGLGLTLEWTGDHKPTVHLGRGE